MRLKGRRMLSTSRRQAAFAGALLGALAVIAMASMALQQSPAALLGAGSPSNAKLEKQIGELQKQLANAETGGRHRSKSHTQRLGTDGEASDSDEAGPSQPVLPYAVHSRKIARTGRSRRGSAEPWTADNQKDYDRAVHHAQIVERTGKEVYRPFQGMFDHEAAKVQKKFVGRFVGLMKTLEPTYMAEALQWARSNDSRENPILTPIVDSLADPMITDLNDEAEVRVDRAVKGIAQKQGLSLPEEEKLRAHLMAPLKTRILNRVHSQVYDYVTRMARSVVLTAANMTASGSNEAVAALNGGDHTLGVGFPTVQPLEDDDARYITLLHDLDGVHKEGIINKYDYNAQKAKLLSDWLKNAVVEAGGNQRKVLMVMFGGKVHGVTDTGLKNERVVPPVNVEDKVKMEDGLRDLVEARNKRLTRDMIYNLVHSKVQWGYLRGCKGKWNTSKRCMDEWQRIKTLVEDTKAGDENDATIHWGDAPVHEVDELDNEGTKRLYKHLSHDAREKIWDKPTEADMVSSLQKGMRLARKAKAQALTQAASKKTKKSTSWWSSLMNIF